MKRKLLYLNWILLILLPWVLFWKLRPYGTYFLMDCLSYVKRSMVITDWSYLPHVLNRNVPANDSFIAILAHITSIPIEHLQFLPIAAIIQLIGFFAIAKKLSNSFLISFLFASIITVNFTFGSSFYTVFVHGMGMALYLIFILSIINLFEERKSNSTYFLISVTIFVGTVFFAYTESFWMIATLGLVSFIKLVERKRKKYKQKNLIALFVLLIIFVIIFLYSQQIIRVYLSKLSLNVLIIKNFISKSLISHSSSPYNYGYTASSPYPLFISNILYITLLLSIASISMIGSFRYLFKNKQTKNSRDYLKFGFIFTAIFEIAIYLPLGYFRVGYLLFILPLLALISLLEMAKNSKRVKFVFIVLIVILVLSIGKNTLYFHYHKFPDISQTNAQSSGKWLYTHGGYNSVVLADISTLGKYNVVWASEGDTLMKCFYNLTIYNSLVNLSRVKNNVLLSKICNYIVIDFKTNKAITSVGWQQFIPLKYYGKEVNKNFNLQHIYSDGSIGIYKV